MSANLTYEWIDRRREPKDPPNPAFPDGIDLNLSRPRQASCRTALPCPAKRVGYYLIKCALCGMTAMVTTAGRPDDPRSVRIACKVTTQ